MKFAHSNPRAFPVLPRVMVFTHIKMFTGVFLSHKTLWVFALYKGKYFLMQIIMQIYKCSILFIIDCMQYFVYYTTVSREAKFLFWEQNSVVYLLLIKCTE